MKNNKQLPCFTPVFATYHYQICNAIPFSINRSYYNWFLNECIALKCKNDLFDVTATLDVTTANTSFIDNPNLFIEHFENGLEWGELVEKIINCINSNTYVYFSGADDFYITNKSFYHKDHIYHDGLIIGYDNEKGELVLFAYDEKWVCKKINVSYEDFERSLKFAYYRDRLAYFASIKPCLNNIPLDVYRIKSLINQYISSLANEKVKISEHIGSVVHEDIIEYISAIQAGYIPLNCIDWRVIRSLWEHKKCMYDRIMELEKYYSLTNNLSQKYEKIVSTTNDLRLMYARYMVSPDNVILNSFSDVLSRNQSEENEILHKLIGVIN